MVAWIPQRGFLYVQLLHRKYGTANILRAFRKHNVLSTLANVLIFASCSYTNGFECKNTYIQYPSTHSTASQRNCFFFWSGSFLRLSVNRMPNQFSLSFYVREKQRLLLQVVYCKQETNWIKMIEIVSKFPANVTHFLIELLQMIRNYWKMYTKSTNGCFCSLICPSN